MEEPILVGVFYFFLTAQIVRKLCKASYLKQTFDFV